MSIFLLIPQGDLTFHNVCCVGDKGSEVCAENEITKENL